MNPQVTAPDARQPAGVQHYPAEMRDYISTEDGVTVVHVPPCEDAAVDTGDPGSSFYDDVARERVASEVAENRSQTRRRDLVQYVVLALVSVVVLATVVAAFVDADAFWRLFAFATATSLAPGVFKLLRAPFASWLGSPAVEDDDSDD